MSKMLQHRCLPYLKMRDSRFQFAHVISDGRYVRSYGTQVLEDEVLDVFH